MAGYKPDRMPNWYIVWILFWLIFYTYAIFGLGHPSLNLWERVILGISLFWLLGGCIPITMLIEYVKE
ncbi:MAG TPA: hypothetical protein VH593_01015, partial [Ktedonobacteraceae bacterium]